MNNIYILESGESGYDLKQFLEESGYNIRLFNDHIPMIDQSIPGIVPDLYILVDNFIDKSSAYKKEVINRIRENDKNVPIIGIVTGDITLSCSKLAENGCINMCPMDFNIIKNMVISLLSQKITRKTKTIRKRLTGMIYGV